MKTEKEKPEKEKEKTWKRKRNEKRKKTNTERSWRSENWKTIGWEKPMGEVSAVDDTASSVRIPQKDLGVSITWSLVSAYGKITKEK